MAFWKKIFKSKYTGAEIDAAIAKAGDATKVTANPSLAGTESALTGLEVGTTKYKVEQPINVVANPTLAGTEAALEGLQVGETKYKVGGGESVLVLAFATETTLNHTYAEVLAAYQNGVPVIFNTEQYTAVGTIAPQQDGSLFMIFTQTAYNSTMSRAEFWQVTLIYNSDGTFTFNFKSYYWNVTASE